MKGGRVRTKINGIPFFIARHLWMLFIYFRIILSFVRFNRRFVETLLCPNKWKYLVGECLIIIRFVLYETSVDDSYRCIKCTYIWLYIINCINNLLIASSNRYDDRLIKHFINSFLKRISRMFAIIKYKTVFDSIATLSLYIILSTYHTTYYYKYRLFFFFVSYRSCSFI